MFGNDGDDEKVIQIDVEDVLVKEAILSGEKQKVSYVMTPKMLIYMGRYLGEIALEYWCREFKEDIFNFRETKTVEEPVNIGFGRAR